MAIPNRGPGLLVVNYVFVTTAIAACALRCFVRVKMVKAFGFDDWLMVLSTVRRLGLYMSKGSSDTFPDILHCLYHIILHRSPLWYRSPFQGLGPRKLREGKTRLVFLLPVLRHVNGLLETVHRLSPLAYQYQKDPYTVSISHTGCI
jgi:hypothetical protein